MYQKPIRKKSDVRLVLNKENLKDADIKTENCGIKGYTSIEEVRGVELATFPVKEIISKLEFKYEPYYDEISKVKGEVPYKGANRCTNCGRCVTVCPYSARKLDFPNMSVDKELCRSCGMCVKTCTTRALSATVAK